MLDGGALAKVKCMDRTIRQGSSLKGLLLYDVARIDWARSKRLRPLFHIRRFWKCLHCIPISQPLAGRLPGTQIENVESTFVIDYD